MNEENHGHLLAVVCHCLCGADTLRILSEAIAQIAETHRLTIPPSCLPWLAALMLLLVAVGGWYVVRKACLAVARIVKRRGREKNR